MFRKEMVVLGSLVGLIFLMAALAMSWVGRAVHQNAALIAEDTLPDLVRAATARARMQENWLRVHLLTHDLAEPERNSLLQQIESASTEELWRDYGAAIYEPEDRANYDSMMAVRADFIKLRDDFSARMRSGRVAETRGFVESKLAPAYEKYRVGSEKLFTYNANLGRERAAKVIRSSRWSPLIFGLFGVVVFALGFLFGLRGAFTGLSLSRLGKSRAERLRY